MDTRSSLVVLAAAVAIAACGAGAAAGAPSTTQSQRVASLEQQILRELNAVRAAHGLRPLARSVGLTAAAVGHSRSMLSAGFFSHASQNGASFADRIRHTYRARGFVRWTVGENILFDSDAVDASAAIASWMASPPHRRNILSAAWRDVGVGVTRTASAPGVFGGSSAWIVTMDFGMRTAKRPSTVS